MTTEQRPSPSAPSAAETGDRLRQRRLELGLSARELARRVSLSSSLISQIERGNSMPSVASLYAIVSELGMSLDELFSVAGPTARTPTRQGRSTRDPVVRADERETLVLASGVRWERLTSETDPRADFHYLIYEPGGASCEDGVLVRHAGYEYGLVITGRLSVVIGFERYELGPGDSISFESAQPHRLATIGDEPVHAVWVVVGRSERDYPAASTAGDGRLSPRRSAPRT